MCFCLLPNATIVSISAGGAVRDELSVCCEDTRPILTVIGKPLAILQSVAGLCAAIGVSSGFHRQKQSIHSKKTHDLDFSHE